LLCDEKLNENNTQHTRQMKFLPIKNESRGYFQPRSGIFNPPLCQLRVNFLDTEEENRVETYNEGTQGLWL
jgi:hypothetical protein